MARLTGHVRQQAGAAFQKAKRPPMAITAPGTVALKVSTNKLSACSIYTRSSTSGAVLAIVRAILRPH
jgi:hypothetical protein